MVNDGFVAVDVKGRAESPGEVLHSQLFAIEAITDIFEFVHNLQVASVLVCFSRGRSFCPCEAKLRSARLRRSPAAGP